MSIPILSTAFCTISSSKAGQKGQRIPIALLAIRNGKSAPQARRSPAPRPACLRAKSGVVVSVALSWRCRAELEKLVRDHAIQPDADPIRNAVSYLESCQVTTKTPALPFANEADDIQPEY